MNNYSTDMSILNLTHADLDGICSTIALKQFFNSLHRISYGYGKFDRFTDDIISLANSGAKFDAMIITDINFTIEQYKKVETVFKEHFTDNILYLDHHSSNKDEMHSPDNNRFVITAVSGAILTLNFFEATFKHKVAKPIRDLITLADDYDRYVKKYQESELLNFLFSKYRDGKFYDRFINGYHGFDNVEINMIAIWRERLQQEYTEIITDPENVKWLTVKSIAFDYKGEYQNDIIDLIFRNHSNVESLIVHTAFGFSVRTISKTTDVGMVLKYLNCGGGHPQAGGISFLKVPTDLPLLLNVLKDIIDCVETYRGEIDDQMMDEFFGIRTKLFQLGMIDGLKIKQD